MGLECSYKEEETRDPTLLPYLSHLPCALTEETM